MITLEIIKRTDPRILQNMSIHYSQPKGFVGRNICYAVMFGGLYYGSIVGGSATMHLPNRNFFFNIDKTKLNNIVNNIFFHIEKVNGSYPMRNFAQKVLGVYRSQIELDWFNRYGDKVIGHESLVELPRTGDCYSRELGFNRQNNWIHLQKNQWNWYR